MNTSMMPSAARAAPVPRLLTAADLLALPTRLPSGDVRYELDDGRLVIMSPPSARHGLVAGKFFGFLEREGEFQGHGIALDEAGIKLRHNPDRVVGADALFITNASLPFRETPEGYLETIPELVVEVRSKNDSLTEVEAKVAEYLTAGVVVVWVADPDARTVTAYRSGQPATIFTAEDELTVPEVIPTFRVRVSHFFPC